LLSDFLTASKFIEEFVVAVRHCCPDGIPIAESRK